MSHLKELYPVNSPNQVLFFEPRNSTMQWGSAHLGLIKLSGSSSAG